MNTPNRTTTRAQRRYTNAALTVIAGLLGLNALSQSGVSTVSTAYAQPAGDEGMVSAAEQRKAIIAELRQLSGKVDRVESALSRGVSVKVIDMPPVRLADPSAMAETKEGRKADRK